MMRNTIFSAVFVAASLCNAFATLTASIHSEARTTFFVGERVNIPVYIEETGAMTMIQQHASGSDGYVLTHLSGNASWLTFEHRQEYADGQTLNTNDPYWHWQNNQVFWIEMSGMATTAGEYSGTLLVQNSQTDESQVLEYAFNVVEPEPGMYVVSYDPAASYGRQIEQRSYVLNKMESPVTLDRPYIDYYMTKTPGKQLILNVWGKPDNTCVQVLDCGSNHYVVRQRYMSSKMFTPGSALLSERFQLGINERSNTSNSNYFDELQEKSINAFYESPGNVNAYYGAGFFVDGEGKDNNLYLDYSYMGYATNYVARAMRRNEYINHTMTLRDASGVTYSGTAPDWYSAASCQEAPLTTETALDPNTVRTFDMNPFCDADDYADLFDIIADTPADEIYEGEDYFFKPVFTSNIGIDVSIEPVAGAQSPLNWIEVGNPANYWTGDYDINHNNNVNTAENRQNIYIRSKHGVVRMNANVAPGTYQYRIIVKKANTSTVIGSLVRTIVVKAGTQHPEANGKSVAVLMGDETWFKPYQLDIATGIVNFSNNFVDLSNFRYEYYGQVESSSANMNLGIYQPHYWYPSSASSTNLDVTFVSCGSGRFRVRYKYKGYLGVSPNRSVLDYKTGFVYGEHSTMTKMDDYSLGDFNEDPPRRRYNPYMPLFDKDNNLLWGNLPDWANQCPDYIGPSPSSSSSSWSSSSRSSSSMSSSSMEIIVRRSSSSSFSEYHDLAVRFKDKGGSGTQRSFLIDVINKGNQSASIGGYTARFYYNDEHLPSEATLYFNNYYKPSGVSEVKWKQCDEHHYVADFVFAPNASVSPSGTLPAGGVEGVFRIEQGGFLDVLPFASWMDVSEMTENGDMALLDAQGNRVYGTPKWPCNDYTKKKLKLVVKGHAKKEDRYFSKINTNVHNAAARINLIVENKGDSAVPGPVYVDFQVTHPSNQVPMMEFWGKILSSAGTSVTINNDIKVTRISAGDKHTFRIILVNGIRANYNGSFNFVLFDQCVNACKDLSEVSSYLWNLSDDWSAQGIIDTPSNQDVKTDSVPIYNSKGELLYGKADPSVPVYAANQANGSGNGEKEALKHNRAVIGAMVPNRTDAAAYSGGQMLSGGDFETPWFQGWEINEPDTSHVVKSIREKSPQGSRHISLSQGTSILQDIGDNASAILADSGAVLTVWHKGGRAYVKLNGDAVDTLNSSGAWVVDTVYIKPTSFNRLTSNYITISPANSSEVFLDDIVLAPYHTAQPTTYATRFTNTAGEELETRAYDGDKEQLVTTSERDDMGRLSKKYLPFAMDCKSVEDCNSDLKTLYNPGMAVGYYTAKNPDYPDAGNVPYVQTDWKPDPMATKDVEGAPGAAFSIGSGHVVRAFSSGVNLSGINLLDSVSLNSAVKAVYNGRKYDSKANYHAAKDTDPTHLWELNLDQNGNAAFTVKDGEGHVIVSGALKKASDNSYVLATRSVNELDERGNVTKSHPPMSCEYTSAPTNCVDPSTYVYDSQSRVIKTVEPDAGITFTYYDPAGRVRATQTQNQIDSGKVSIVGYDHLDRTVYTGEWKTDRDSVKLRAFFSSLDSIDYLDVDSLTPGTITRTFYDRMPARDILGVELYPQGIVPDPTYTRGRVAAIISDVKAVYNDDGAPKQAADGKDSVIRVSTANSYDKYGRVIASYAYDPTLPDSLKQLWTTTEYDVGGKVLSTTKYPYGSTFGSAIFRAVTERYTYDRLGRVSYIDSKNGTAPLVELAHYEYYPTGSVRTVTLGNSLTISYTYHISGAVKTAAVISAKKDGPNPDTLYSEKLYYEDCGSSNCAQYNGNISRMKQLLAHGSNSGDRRDVTYLYDELNRLINVNDSKQDVFDEIFAYDAQGRIVAQRRDTSIAKNIGGEYAYYANTNKLKSVASGMGGTTADERNMSDTANFVYDSEGNLVEDKSKRMKISYDWRGMPVEFRLEPTGSSSDTTRLAMMYDGSGRRISKTLLTKSATATSWDTVKVTHYTGIGTEIREEFHNGTREKVSVVVNMPQGLGRYGIEDAADPFKGIPLDENGKPTSWSTLNPKFEWFLKNHLGSTMLVYGTVSSTDPNTADIGETKAAYDYRAFGEMVTLTQPSDKVTENFTGKEHDEEIKLNYFGARYLDPMLGLWISVDPKRQFSSPYLYAGNGVTPVNIIDPDGEAPYQIAVFMDILRAEKGEANLDVFRDFEAASRWGYKKFKDDFDIRIVRSPNELLDFIKEGQYTAIVGHTWSGEKGKIFNRTHSPAVQLDLTALDNALIGSESLVKVFGCRTGSWNMGFKKIEYGGNKGALPIGDAFKEAAQFLTESRDLDQRLENSKPVTQDE